MTDAGADLVLELVLDGAEDYRAERSKRTCCPAAESVLDAVYID